MYHKVLWCYLFILTLLDISLNTKLTAQGESHGKIDFYRKRWYSFEYAKIILVPADFKTNKVVELQFQYKYLACNSASHRERRDVIFDQGRACLSFFY